MRTALWLEKVCTGDYILLSTFLVSLHHHIMGGPPLVWDAKSDAKCMILENVFLATCAEAAFVKSSSASIHPTDTYCLRQWLPWKRFHKSSLSVLERENRNKWTDTFLRISVCLNEGCAFFVLSLTTKPHVPVADTQSERFVNNGGW